MVLSLLVMVLGLLGVMASLLVMMAGLLMMMARLLVVMGRLLGMVVGQLMVQAFALLSRSKTSNCERTKNCDCRKRFARHSYPFDRFQLL